MTVGYGDLNPMSDEEKIFTITVMVIACGVFAYILGSIQTIFQRDETLISEFR